MPTFCRHNRFIERCPICSKTLPGAEPPQRARATPGARGPQTGPRARRAAGARAGAPSLLVRREDRSEDDGYRCGLVPGLHASADARRLAEEIAFASGRLAALGEHPPGLYGEVRAMAAQDIERASWSCFLIAYLSPLQDGDPFATVRGVLAQTPTLDELSEPIDLDGLPLGPRTQHEPGRGGETLRAYRQWVRRAGAPSGTQAVAFVGDPAWSPQRRFERLFERLSLPGLGRSGRFELLVTLGALGLYPMQADSLHLAPAGGDQTTLAAKRVFGIGDPAVLGRRATALAQAVGVPIETLDVALTNWGNTQRATLGVAADTAEDSVLGRAVGALEA